VVIGMSSSLHLQADSEKTVANTKTWYSPIPYFQPRIKEPRSNLLIACVVGNRLYQGLRFEANCLLLKPENWKRVLQYTKPDFILMESCWDTVTGDWYLAQTHPGEEHKILRDILGYARRKNIPTVFWNTQDTLYHYLFNNFAKGFDYVFCADPRESVALTKQSINNEVLLPAIQPALHNPFKDFLHARNFSLQMLYDGWADILRLSGNLAFLKDLLNFGLVIIESRFRLFRNKIDERPEFTENILGCVHWRDRLMALKYSTLCLMADATISTPTSQQWTALENAACRVPVLFRGSLMDDDIRRDIVTAIPLDDEFVSNTCVMLENELQRQKMAHLGWRTVYQKHTFSHRINSICNVMGISYDVLENPLVSIVIATFREQYLPRCMENFTKQTYPNKELILVVNSNTFSKEQARDLIGDSTNIHIYVVPNERVEGGCLNFGIMSANGKFCIKMDDDDYYSPSYVADMILHGKSVDADVFGKTNRYIHFMDDNKTYSRRTKPELTVIPSNLLLTAHISGNSLSGKTEFFQNKKYSDINFASTDTSFHGNLEGNNGIFALFDDIGLIMERREDTLSHSWTISSESLKQTMEFVCNGVCDELLI